MYFLESLAEAASLSSLGSLFQSLGAAIEKLYLRKFSNKLLAHAIAVEMPIGGGVCILDNESTQLYN